MLTSDKTIKIDSDISTTSSKDFKWNGLTLTDTPGLYTENPDHDEITIESIKRADLLVYCITSDLFNPFTVEDFKKWAFETGYSGKMFLIVNKMSKEAGTFDELVKNYTESLNKDLVPYSLATIPHCFVDLEFADELGVRNVSFIGMSKLNEYCKLYYVDPAHINWSQNRGFHIWNAYQDHDYCSCSSGSYDGKYGSIRFYFRRIGKGRAPYARQLVYTADNRLLAGFSGNEIRFDEKR